jgi:hypothetical protein
MHLFKHKKKTYNPKKEVTIPSTIDDKHQAKLEELNNQYKSIPLKENELKLLEDKYINLQSIKENLTDEIIEEKLQCKENIINLKKEIEKIKLDYENKNYELNTCHLLYQYYSDDKPAITKIQTSSMNKKTILDFFKNEKTLENNNENNQLNEQNSQNVLKMSKAEIMDEYLSYTDPTYIKKTAFNTYYEEICQICKEQKIINFMESILICPTCGAEDKILIDSELPSYKEPPREVTYFAYKRINHFKEWLSQLQAKESTNIDKEIFDKIYTELNKEKYIERSKLKTEQVLQILKKLGLSKYYEHCSYITNQISGRPPLNIDPETEEKAINMFKEVQGPWMKYGMTDRSNFFSYPYILYKFFQLLEKDEYLPELRLLKTREKLQEQDEVWKKICDELKWQFIRTV